MQEAADAADAALLPFPPPTRARLATLVGGEPHLALLDLHAGYGKMEVLHGIDLLVGRGQSLCIIGPNGSGKSTVLNALFGLADVLAGELRVAGRDVRGASSAAMLMEAKVAYVLQNSSVFPDMTVEENLLMGGHRLGSRRAAAQAVERILDAHPRLAERRREPAGALSGGERRMLELSRALITDPAILLVDEPSIGLEPRTIDAVFAMLDRLQRTEGRTIVMVEQNAKMGLDFADLGYVLVAGRLALADRARAVRENPEVARLFLGG
ncbi:MAG TPA: ABC transporter ATP-binding protein [Beijerinckiaceae bacterium]|nr:ABC transporter ATP-binding protein [Beijerinckiaceae bacterium]